ncbi:hypothetical protein [Shewanella algae]|nr:hypothetical protein [Shewanella algae]
MAAFIAPQEGGFGLSQLNINHPACRSEGTCGNDQVIEGTY